MAYRDYIDTSIQINDNTSVTFFIEEINYVLDGFRDAQIEHIGSMISYFNNLIYLSEYPNLQKVLFIKSLKYNINNLDIKYIFNNIQELNNLETLISYLNLVNHYLSYNKKVFRLICMWAINYLKNYKLHDNKTFNNLLSHFINTVSILFFQNNCIDKKSAELCTQYIYNLKLMFSKQVYPDFIQHFFDRFFTFSNDNSSLFSQIKLYTILINNPKIIPMNIDINKKAMTDSYENIRQYIYN